MSKAEDEETRRGYEWHVRRHARKLADGVGLIMLGVSLSTLGTLLPQHKAEDIDKVIEWIDDVIKHESHELISFSSNQTHPESFLVFIVTLIIGITMLRNEVEDNRDYHEAYPRMNFRYSQEERRAVGREHLAWIIGCVALIVLVHVLIALFTNHVWPSALNTGLSQLALTAGVWGLVYSSVWYGRVNVKVYNFMSLRSMNIYELRKHDEINGIPDYRSVREKNYSDWDANLSHFSIALGVLTAAAFYYLPTLRTSLFWIPMLVILIIGLIIRSFIVHHAINAFEK
ncbi:hypothetical protein [Bifidobacterium magnum]|uniref:Transcriptional regulator n=1 Tax=Bifidobacterium magnum TaxID=1692 RepID=A0A087BE98_9BIFI|nr:hypothetical protein [Bifidobacterium magnum]KFI69348.1 transcriptional regulator [Bifidobacterium magnum]